MSEKRRLPTFVLLLIGAVAGGFVIFLVFMLIMYGQLGGFVRADVCAAVVSIYPNYVHLEIVRGYNEFWDKQIGVNILVGSENPDIKVDDRLTLTANALWGKWIIDWDKPYDNCPEAISGTSR